MLPAFTKRQDNVIATNENAHKCIALLSDYMPMAIMLHPEAYNKASFYECSI